MTKEEEEEAREAITYRICKDFGEKSNVYRIDKIICETVADSYHVTIHPNRPGGTLREQDVWCDCMGMRRQTYPHTQHKHVVLALDFIERGLPGGATYTIIGTGKNAKIKFLRTTG